MCSTWIKDSPSGRLSFPVILTLSDNVKKQLLLKKNMFLFGRVSIKHVDLHVCSEHVLLVQRLITVVTDVIEPPQVDTEDLAKCI